MQSEIFSVAASLDPLLSSMPFDTPQRLTRRRSSAGPVPPWRPLNNGGDCDGAMNNHNNGTKEHLHSNNTSARIEGYNIYRDNIEIYYRESLVNI